MASGSGGEAKGPRDLDATVAPGCANRICDRGQGTEAAVDLLTVVSCEDGAAQAASSCSMAVDEAGDVPKAAQEFAKYYKRWRFPKVKTSVSGKIASSSKRTLNRDLPDQLEARAHHLLKNAGWRITPRIRNERSKMAYYFAAPQREVVVTSLVQAWKFCGHKFHAASGGSEWGKFPMDWSDVDQFWKDLVTALEYVEKMTAEGEEQLTLSRQWHILDPFVAVVFIDRRIIALQKQKTIVAVDSSTRVVHDSNNRSSGASCNRYKDVQYLRSSQETRVKPELCCTQHMDPEVARGRENHFQSNSEEGNICCRVNLGNNLVKRVRKKSRWLSDFESTGLNGLYARSFTQPSIGSNESGSCSTKRNMSKKHVKAENESEKLSGLKGDLVLRLAHERTNDTRSEGTTEGLVEPNGCSEIKYDVTELGAKKLSLPKGNSQGH